MIAANILNAAPFRDKQTKVFSPDDFFPDPEHEKPQQTIEEQLAVVKSVVADYQRPARTPKKKKK